MYVPAAAVSAVPASRAPEPAQAGSKEPSWHSIQRSKVSGVPTAHGPGEVLGEMCSLWRHCGPMAEFPDVLAMGIPGAGVRPASKSSRPGSVSWGRIHAFLQKSTYIQRSFLPTGLASPQRHCREELTKNGKSKRQQ